MDIIQIKNLFFSYIGEKKFVIKDISLEVKEGDILSLVGASGSGKSTLLLCLNGIIPKLIPGRIGGSIKICGKNIRDIPVSELHEDIQIMFQNPETQFFSFNVFDEIAFGLENKGFNKTKINQKVDEVLTLLSINHLKDRSVEELSSGEKQQVILATLIALRPKILVLDEPTANLDPLQTRKLSALLKKINKELGMTIILSEHDLDFVKISDEILYMDRGVLKKYSGQLQERYPDFGEISPKKENILTVENVYFKHNQNPILKGINFELKSSEILGIVGFNGSGKSTLAQNIVGLLRPNKGRITYDDEVISGKKIAYISKKIGYVFQNPDYSLFENKVIDELKFGAMNRQYDNKEIKYITDNLIDELELKSIKDDDPDNLSLGQKRRVSIGSILSMKPELLIVDEPDTGLDRKRSIKLAGLFGNLNKQGTAILLISHNIDFLKSICHRIVLIHDGVICDPKKYLDMGVEENEDV